MPTGNPPKVMLIEDDASMRNVLRTLLEIEGYQVVTPKDMSSDTEILSQVKIERPDIVLLDVHLRDRANGFEILQAVRADAALSGTRVVMSSGMDLRDKCLKSGADDFLLKPYMPDELLEKLHGIVSSR